MLKHIPNFLTCCNLVCGCLGILFLFEGSTIPTAYFVLAAGIFDFFDGFAARLFKANSPIGKDLDSLADMVSFGALPALFMYKTLSFESTLPYLPYLGFLIAVCAALRLAKFNIDETQSDSFKGLPVPANTIFITGIPFLTQPIFDFVHSPAALSAITIIFSLLMVSRFDLFALKFKKFSWGDNKIRFTFLILSVLLVALLHWAALPLLILLYIAMSLSLQSILK